MSNGIGPASNLSSGSYLRVIDRDLRLSLATGELQAPIIDGLHLCSYCKKSFDSLQALGGHQTAHRREIEQMRRQHQAYMAGLHLSLALPRGSIQQADSDRRSWEIPLATKREVSCPQLVDYIGIQGNDAEKTRSSRGGIVDDVKVTKHTQIEQVEEASIENLDLTLGYDGIDLTLRL